MYEEIKGVTLSEDGENLKYSLLAKRRDKSLVVLCPRCGRAGRLYFNKNIGWYVKHFDTKQTHALPHDASLTIPLSEERLNLIRYMGGDSYLLPYLIKMFPPHRTYVEVFGGGAPLLLNKYPSPVEVYNDFDCELTNLFNVVAHHFDEFKKYSEWALYSRNTYYQYLKDIETETDKVKRAWIYFYLMNACYSGKFAAGFSTGPTRNHAKSFFNALKKLKKIHKRLQNVVVENLDFRELIKRYDSKETFFYIDPPHLFIATEKGKYYKEDGFSDKEFMELLNLIENIKGKWLLKQTDVVPWFNEWAKERNYDVLSLTISKFSYKSSGEEKPQLKYIFVANYKITNVKFKKVR